MSTRSLVAIGALLVLVAGCGVGAGAASRASGGAAGPSGAELRALPISPYGSGQTLCAGVAHLGPIRLVEVSGVIAGDGGSAATIAIRWPAGYHAVVDPAFVEVLTDTGTVFAKADDDINTQTGVFNNHVVCYQGRNGIDIWRQPPPSPS